MKLAVLTLARYPSKYIIPALHSMPAFRLPLITNRKVEFFKLLGCGRSGSFDLNPDWRQYAIFSVSDSENVMPFNTAQYEEWKKNYYGKFISRWWRFFGCETRTIILEPTLSHGKWSGVELFPNAKNNQAEGPVAVLTRATIRASKAMDFWKNVGPIQKIMPGTPGLLFSVGIGEIPVLKQATFSIWENAEKMKSFAYSMHHHREVINKTRSRDWYSEEMFTRFRIIGHRGWTGI